MNALKNEKQVRIKALQGLVNNLLMVSNIMNSIANTLSTVDWWSKADYYKNRGFYSGYENHLVLPSHIKESEYLEAKKPITEMIQFLDDIREYFGKVNQKDLDKFINVWVHFGNKPKPITEICDSEKDHLLISTSQNLGDEIVELNYIPLFSNFIRSALDYNSQLFMTLKEHKLWKKYCLLNYIDSDWIPDQEGI